jgi:hypothetical protein
MDRDRSTHNPLPPIDPNHSGLVAYHSDEEEEEEHEQTGCVPTKRAAGSDATTADAAAEGHGSAQQNGKDGENDDEAAERERARLAAAEVG